MIHNPSTHLGFVKELIHQGNKRLVEGEEKKRDGGAVAIATTPATSVAAAAKEPISRKRPMDNKPDIAPR